MNDRGHIVSGHGVHKKPWHQWTGKSRKTYGKLSQGAREALARTRLARELEAANG